MKSTRLFSAGLLMCLTFFATASNAVDLKKRVEFNIPSQPVAIALTAFSEQAGIATLFPLELVEGLTSRSLVGNYSINEGLDILLDQTGLKGVVTTSGEFHLRRLPPVDISTPKLIEEVRVTARGREENLQDVPLSVVTFSGVELSSRNIENVEDLNVYLPNVNIRAGGVSASQGLFFMRGIPGVARYVDGVVQQDDAGALFNIVGLERVEILKGPQGTLFGKNAIAGAIQYFTESPKPVLSGSLRFTGGSYDRGDVVANIDIPLSENLWTKVTAAALRRDGYVDKLGSSVRFGNVHNDLFRAQLRWQPLEALRTRVILEKNTVDQLPQANVLWGLVENHPQVIAYNTLGLEFTNQSHAFGAREQYVSRSEYTGRGDLFDSRAITANVEWDLGPTLTLKSISGLRQFDWGNTQDHDASEYAFYEQSDWQEHEEGSEEVQLHYHGNKLSGVMGFYYAREQIDSRELRWQYEAIQSRPTNSVVDTNTVDKAVFAEGSYPLSDQIAVTLGLRYTREHYRNSVFAAAEARPATLTMSRNLARGAMSSAGSASFESLTPRLSFQYRMNSNAMVFINFAEGFNGGGVNRAPVNGVYLPYGAETLDQVELGLRSDWLSKRLRVNSTLFYGDWHDIQVAEVIIPGQATIRNAGAARIEGYELELAWLPTSALAIDVAFGNLEAKYTELDSTATITLDSTLQLAPHTSYSLGVSYDWTVIGDSSLSFRVDYGWLARHVTVRDDSLQKEQAAYGLLSSRINFTPARGNWSVAAFGTNLTNEYYQLGGFFASRGGVDQGVVARPREWGISLTAAF